MPNQTIKPTRIRQTPHSSGHPIPKLASNYGISIRTLKRLFGMEKAPPGYYPYFGTREILCAYAGFSDWAEFVRANSNAEAPRIAAKALPSKPTPASLEALSADMRYVQTQEPLRDLDWLRLDDSRMFLGRKKAALEIQAYLASPYGDQVVLIYGLSSVGQSSFLHRGLMQGLSAHCTIHYYRKEKGNRLSVLLSTILASIATSNRPIVAILDQIEAVYGGTIEAGDEELLEFTTQLAASLRRLPFLKILLSFRKEYFADIDACLTSQGIDYKRYFL